MRPGLVMVYVEGPSDKLAMQRLLSPILDQALRQGVKITFHPFNGKKNLLMEGPRRAADILASTPDTQVVILPDLYPKNQGGDHETLPELRRLLQNRFQECLKQKHCESADSLPERLHVHCFKYELEVLLLAAAEEVAAYLGGKEIKKDWKLPVEDQDHNNPPKNFLKKIFQDRDQWYRDTVDAPAILGQANLDRLKKECPQCFAPLVEFLEQFAA